MLVGVSGEPRVLLVDHNSKLLADASRWCAEGARIVTATTPRESLRTAREHRPSVAIIEWFLGRDVCGVDLIAPLREIVPDMRIAIASAALTTYRIQFATRMGADIAVDKPFTLAQVLRWLESGVERGDVETEALDSLEANEQRLIARVLAESGGNLRQTARRLAISRNRLKRKLDQFPTFPRMSR